MMRRYVAAHLRLPPRLCEVGIKKGAAKEPSSYLCVEMQLTIEERRCRFYEPITLGLGNHV